MYTFNYFKRKWHIFKLIFFKAFEINNERMFRIFIKFADNQANTRRSTNVGLMLARRLRLRTNISPTLGERLVFTGNQLSHITLWIVDLFKGFWWDARTQNKAFTLADGCLCLVIIAPTWYWAYNMRIHNLFVSHGRSTWSHSISAYVPNINTFTIFTFRAISTEWMAVSRIISIL